MFVQLSAAVSLNGVLDDGGPERLKLSSEADMLAVYDARARFDAILVGAETIRRDNPSLALSDRFPHLVKQRRGQGMPNDPAKVTVTRTGALDPDAKFFQTGTGTRYVLCPMDIAPAVKARLGERASVLPLPAEMPLAAAIVQVLSDQGLGGLFVEGGGSILSAFLREELGDRLRLAIAPVITGDAGTLPRFSLADISKRYPVEKTEVLEDTVVMHLVLKP